MILAGERKSLLTTTYILESFRIRKELGLDDSYIMSPVRENFYIQRQIITKCWWYCESNSYKFDNFNAWMNLDKLLEMLICRQKLLDRIEMKKKGQ